MEVETYTRHGHLVVSAFSKDLFIYLRWGESTQVGGGEEERILSRLHATCGAQYGA